MSTEFLQSREWLRLQEATGKGIIPLEEEDFMANGIVHTLPVVGSYLYVPRGPKIGSMKQEVGIKNGMQRLIQTAKEKKMKWMRIEPETEEALEAIKAVVSKRVVPAPHDMQPREIFKIAISKTEEELLAGMKPKTRYNIRLAEKRGVRVNETREAKHIEAFLGLITATSGRKGITSHPKSYYEKFFQILPREMCRLFVAEYQGEIIAANLVMFYGDTVTYLHGGTSDAHRDAMAPYLLQWEQIKVAKREGYHYYDFGGVHTRVENEKSKQKDWEGITRFKVGFAPATAPTVYPGTHDIILDSRGYLLYDWLRHLQTLKRLVAR